MAHSAAVRIEKNEVEPHHPLLSHDPRWQVAQRAASSEIFARSGFLPKFLLYICELALLGKTDEIKEQQIGVRVFNRPPNYNPGDDNIVRNYAVQLRKRLSLYFEQEGQREPYIIEIPRGGYVPVFHSQPAHSEAIAAEAVPQEIAEKPQEHIPAVLPERQVARKANWLMFFCGMGFALLLFVAFLAFSKAHSLTAAANTGSNRLWSTIFPRGRETLVVPADSGFGILQNLTEQPATLDSYLNGEYLSQIKVKGVNLDNIDDLRTQRYTSMVDLEIIFRLMHLPEAGAGSLVIRYARDLRMDDLKSGNVVLLGAIHTDPWVSLLQKNLNFQFVCEKRVNDCYIQNSHPTQGELPTYRTSSSDGSYETYAIAALLPNLNHTGYVLLIEGLNMAGTEASANTLLDDATMNSLLHGTMARGGAMKPFELLIKTGSIGAEALPAKVIASRMGE